jgi:hypothetical protein
VVSRALVGSKVPGRAAISYLGLLVLAVQGFHVIEHMVVVVQVTALGTGLDEAHGLLGAQVDFEWLHFSYNLAFLGALVTLLAYGWGATLAARRGPPMAALAAAVALQTYHVGEHVLRIYQYLTSACNPCEGLIGQLVLFIWPHFFFGLIGYIAFVAFYFAYGLFPPPGFPRLRLTRRAESS